MTRTVFTYGGYDELWSDDYKLKIRYHRPREYKMIFDGNTWQPEDTVHPFMAKYLRSAAVFAEAVEKCGNIEDIHEYLPDCSELLPEELFRLLLDECGLEIDKATEIIIRCFGELLLTQDDHNFLFDMQPRTAALTKVLAESISAHAYHDAYCEKYRFPSGAVEDGTDIKFSLCSFGGIRNAALLISSDYVNLSVPMEQEGNFFVCSYTPESPAAINYRFSLNDGQIIIGAYRDKHHSIEGCSADAFRLTVYKKGFETPDWFSRSIMYQIFPDRFGFSHRNEAKAGLEYHKKLGQTPDWHGSISETPKWKAREFESAYSPDDFYGGTLKGIEEKLPYLKKLGIGVIYLNPICEARSNHRYDSSDYLNVDPILGSVSDYVNLCEAAAKLGIRIINDGVFSHTGADSLYFNRYGTYDSFGACQGQNSPYYSWYDFKSFPEDYRCWWNFKDLPEVNESDPKWQDFIIKNENSVVRRWLKNGASGWRLDVADELPDEVLQLIREAAKAEKPESVIIGEVWEDAVTKISYGKKRNYALGYSLDSVMNYPLRSNVLAFAKGEISAFELRDFLLEQKYNYPEPMYRCLMNLLGSHDVERLHTALACREDLRALTRDEQLLIIPDKDALEKATQLQKLCAMIQYFLPGVPCLYYGDEECLDGVLDPFNRAPFEPNECGLHNFYASLGKLRNGSEALMQGDVDIRADGKDVLIIERAFEREKFSCIINRSDIPYKLNTRFARPMLNGFEKEIPALSGEIFKLT